MHAGLRWITAAVAGTVAALAAAPAAFAHLEGAGASGIATGLLHPLTGADHLLAMVAVGLWAAQRGGAERWRLPAAFLAAMLAGSAAALAGLSVAGVEVGLALSVLLLGALLLAAPALSGSTALVLVASAALLHGLAHGSELAAGLSPLSYGTGLLLATAGLHGLGVAGGVLLLRTRLPGAAVALRAGGAGIALLGAVLTTALL